MIAHLAGDAYTRGWKASVQTALGMKYIAYGFLVCLFSTSAHLVLNSLLTLYRAHVLSLLSAYNPLDLFEVHSTRRLNYRT